jgi:integrase
MPGTGTAPRSCATCSRRGTRGSRGSSALVDCCDPHFRPLAVAAYYSGQRPQELLALKWGDVNFGDKTLTVFRRKVGLNA